MPLPNTSRASHRNCTCLFFAQRRQFSYSSDEMGPIIACNFLTCIVNRRHLWPTTCCALWENPTTSKVHGQLDNVAMTWHDSPLRALYMQIAYWFFRYRSILASAFHLSISISWHTANKRRQRTLESLLSYFRELKVKSPSGNVFFSFTAMVNWQRIRRIWQRGEQNILS